MLFTLEGTLIQGARELFFKHISHVNDYVALIIPQNAAKQAAAAATQTIAAAQNAAASNKNTAAHQQLVQSCKVNFTVIIFYLFIYIIQNTVYIIVLYCENPQYND